MVTWDNSKGKIFFIADYYGKDSQLGICQEECAELIQAISKYKRNPSPETRENIIGEIADVWIMLRQTAYLIRLEDDALAKYIQKKLERQLQRIKET